MELGQAPPGASWQQVHIRWLSARPAFHLAYFYCCVMSGFWKLEVTSCAMRRMQQSIYFMFISLNISPRLAC